MLAEGRRSGNWVLKFAPANGKKSKGSKGETRENGLTVGGSAATVADGVETKPSPV